jgi:hypothetical protein
VVRQPETQADRCHCPESGPLITLRSLAAAIHKSNSIRLRVEREAAALATAKQREQAAREAEREAETRLRVDMIADADGSRAAAKAAREERLKQERLDFLAAQYARIV